MPGSESFPGGFELPRNFSDVLSIANAAERFGEAREVARQTAAAGVESDVPPAQMAWW